MDKDIEFLNYEIIKKGRKWYEGRHTEKGWKAKIEINEFSKDWQIGDKISFYCWKEIKKSRFGVEVKIYPISSEEGEQILKEKNKKKLLEDLNKWMGYVLNKKDEGYLYIKGIEKIKSIANELNDEKIKEKVKNFITEIEKEVKEHKLKKEIENLRKTLLNPYNTYSFLKKYIKYKKYRDKIEDEIIDSFKNSFKAGVEKLTKEYKNNFFYFFKRLTEKIIESVDIVIEVDKNFYRDIIKNILSEREKKFNFKNTLFIETKIENFKSFLKILKEKEIISEEEFEKYKNIFSNIDNEKKEKIEKLLILFKKIFPEIKNNKEKEKELQNFLLNQLNYKTLNNIFQDIKNIDDYTFIPPELNCFYNIKYFSDFFKKNLDVKVFGLPFKNEIKELTLNRTKRFLTFIGIPQKEKDKILESFFNQNKIFFWIIPEEKKDLIFKLKDILTSFNEYVYKELQEMDGEVEFNIFPESWNYIKREFVAILDKNLNFDFITSLDNFSSSGKNASLYVYEEMINNNDIIVVKKGSYKNIKMHIYRKENNNYIYLLSVNSIDELKKEIIKNIINKYLLEKEKNKTEEIDENLNF